MVSDERLTTRPASGQEPSLSTPILSRARSILLQVDVVDVDRPSLSKGARKGLLMPRHLISTFTCALLAALTVFLPSAAFAGGSTSRPSSTQAISVQAWANASDGRSTPTSPTSARGVVRLSGKDRYATAAVVAASWPAGPQTAFIASGETFQDALSAASRAGAERSPLLLTRSARLPNQTIAELLRLRPEEIVVVGDSSDVSDSVLTQLRDYTTSGQVVRVSGGTHTETSVAVSQLYPTKVATAYLASVEDFPDALAGAALAGHQGAPLLLTRKSGLSSAVRTELVRLAPRQIIVLGGPAAVSKTVFDSAAPLSRSPIRRVAGPTRYHTAAAVAAEFTSGSRTRYIALSLIHI